MFMTLALFLFLISYVFSERFIQFLNPTLYASKMERSVTLLAVPQG
jgi:hypothetical protein